MAYVVQYGLLSLLDETESEVYMINSKNVCLTKGELQLIYAACMSYGDKLSEITKSISDEEENIVNNLSDRAKDSWGLARKIKEYMEDK